MIKNGYCGYSLKPRKREKYNYAESNFQRTVVRYLKLNKIFCFSVPNGQQLRLLQAKIAKAEGLTKGVSDLVILLPKRTVFVEFKNPNGKGTQSPSQKEFEEKVKSLGFEYYIWDNWKQVDEFVGGINGK